MDDSKETVIKVSKLHKSFKLPSQKVSSLKSIFTDFKLATHQSYETQTALKDINFEVKKGEFFGIVGRNGSGKSTLLKILAGIYQPTKGNMQTHGKLVPFIELGVGFNPELNGRDNVYLNGAMLGFTQKQVDAKYDDIVDFAELHKFMGQKLKNYSSGMQVRLAFSVATVLAESDILLLDEVLAVGDADFQRKCFDYFNNLKKQKKTVVFVSHDMNAIREYCDRAVLIEKNEIIVAGTAQKVANEYTKMFIDAGPSKNGSNKDNTNRWGDESIRFTKIKVEPARVKPTTKHVVITLEAKALKDTEGPLFGFLIKNAMGIHLFGTNNVILQKKVQDMKAGDSVRVQWKVPHIFNDGTHYVDPAITYNGGTQTADWWEEATKFNVLSDKKTPYLVNPDVQLEVKKL